jgi:Tol biopolymer transport system component
MRRIEVATGRQVVLAEPFRAIHGLGPMWSPDGSTIAFMRSTSGEHHDIVLLRADPAAAAAGPGAETLLHTSRTLDDGSTIDLSPWRATWSPDGRYVLDVGWTYPNESTEETWIVAVPADANAPSIMLAAVDGIGPYDYAMGSPRVSIQVWQRRPAPLP